jgi:flavin reductase (DIM6/NTAB) family NADH-FMN oxidoreductase RutF
MQREDIPFGKLLLPAVSIWDRQWLLLAAGDFQKHDFNCMTVGWGSFGVMWGRPFAMVVVRPTRHTWNLMERSDSFTLSAYSEEHRQQLSYCGSHSGRDGDKAKACGLTACASTRVASPSFDEAELLIECAKIYRDDLDPQRFLDPSIEGNYPKKDYHRVYFGQIVAISGIAAYRVQE